jgi:hypothetical protein
MEEADGLVHGLAYGLVLIYVIVRDLCILCETCR